MGFPPRPQKVRPPSAQICFNFGEQNNPRRQRWLNSQAELMAEAMRLIAAGEMPTLAQVVTAIEEARAELRPKLHEVWLGELQEDLAALVRKRP